MKASKARIVVAAAIFAVLSLCIAFGVSVGTFCGFGWSDVAALCPLGAVFSMLSSKAVIPQGLVCIALAAAAVLLLGRAFCAWVCPVSLLDRLRDCLAPRTKREAAQAERLAENRAVASREIAKATSCPPGCSCSAHASDDDADAPRRPALDSRHAVLGAAALASVAFGFPVFCLICPVGLSLALVAALVALFGSGTLNWSIPFIIGALLVEFVFLRKWCSRFCPISALINLGARFNRTARVRIDNAACLETSKGVACSMCATVCPYDVNLRHPEYGELSEHDCTRCMECVDACPAQAISLRLAASSDEGFVMQLEENADSQTLEEHGR